MTGAGRETAGWVNDMFADVEDKIRKGNQILFSRNSACLQELLRLMEAQSHRTLVLWALDCAAVPLAKLAEHCPAEDRPRMAIDASRAWARGEIKMPAAKRAILGAHAAAKEMKALADAALCHAVGHAGATVHVETHAIGLPMYELTAIVNECGFRDYQGAAAEKIEFYRQHLCYWQENTDNAGLPWADFLLDDSRPNKEKLLHEKRR